MTHLPQVYLLHFLTLSARDNIRINPYLEDGKKEGI